MIGDLLVLIAIGLSVLFYIWQRHNYTYWQRKGVKGIKPTPIVGNFGDLVRLRKSLSQQLQALHEAKDFHDEPIVGIYGFFRPALIIRDVALIKQVMIKDFNHFTNRVMRADPHHDPLGSNNLFFAHNSEWRNLRSKISPVFTSGKIKQMYPLMVEVGRELESYLAALPKGFELDVRDVCGRFTTELIGTIAFGIRANSLKDPKSEFYYYSCAIFSTTIKRALEFVVLLTAPALSLLMRTKVFSKPTTDFMRANFGHVLADREKSGVFRNDLIDHLLAMKRDALADPKQANPAKNLDYLLAQALIFQTAGFETSSSTMTFTLYELAMNPQIQTQLRAEITAAFEENETYISYEKLQELPYLGRVIDETLRKYPILAFIERECTAVAGGSGYQLKNDVVVPVGTAIYVSAYSIHHDEKYWPDPEKFDPDRFAPENREKINRDAYMPFGSGPRNCIGMRLGLLQAKLGLVHLLRSYRVVRCNKTPAQIEFNPKSVLLVCKGNVYLRLESCETV